MLDQVLKEKLVYVFSCREGCFLCQSPTQSFVGRFGRPEESEHFEQCSLWWIRFDGVVLCVVVAQIPKAGKFAAGERALTKNQKNRVERPDFEGL